jgi:hypothetical protein
VFVYVVACGCREKSKDVLNSSVGSWWPRVCVCSGVWMQREV